MGEEGNGVRLTQADPVPLSAIFTLGVAGNEPFLRFPEHMKREQQENAENAKSWEPA